MCFAPQVDYFINGRYVIKKSFDREASLSLTHSLTVTLPLDKLVDLVRAPASWKPVTFYHCNSEQMSCRTWDTPVFLTKFPPPLNKFLFNE